jgi:YHS domain-containing protein
MNRLAIIVALASMGVFAAGCATPRQGATGTAASQEQATCCVCRYNNDLACLQVAVKETTPRAEYQGKTYCFCSQSCKAAFAKKPEKYLAR